MLLYKVLEPIELNSEKFPTDLPSEIHKNIVIEIISSYGNKETFNEYQRYNWSNVYTRRAIAYSLKKFKIFPAVDTLVNMLDDNDYGVQAEALLSLGYMANSYSGNWIFYYLENQNQKLGYHHKVEIPYHEKGSLNDKVHDDHIYSSIFPNGQKNSDYFKSLFLNLSIDKRYIKEHFKLTGLIGRKIDLQYLFTNYSALVETRIVSLEFFLEAVNVIDERLYSKRVFQKRYRESPIYERWWN